MKAFIQQNPCFVLKSAAGLSLKYWILPTLTSLINVEPTLTDFEKFHSPQKKIPPPRLLIS